MSQTILNAPMPASPPPTPSAEASKPRTAAVPLVLRASSGWSALRLREVWQFRDLLFTLAGRDLKLRYKQTALGAAWVVVQPLAAAGIFNFVFGTVAGMKTSFAMTFAGMMAWTLFSSTLSKASGCLVGNAHLISKVYFPRLILPLSSIPSTFVDFGVSLLMMAALMIFQGIVPGVGLALLPVWIVLLLLLSMGFGLITASLMVTYRDVAYVLPVVMQLLLYLSPIAYSAESVASKGPLVAMAYYLNPLTPLIEGFKWSLTGQGDMQWGYAGCSAAVCVGAMFIGAFSFKRMERRFADVI